MGEWIKRRRLFVLAGAVVVVVAAALFLWPGGSEEPPRVAEPVRPVLTPLRLADSPMWTSRGVVELSASGVEVVGDTMLIFQGAERITAVDTATGQARWTLARGHDLTGHGGVWNGGVSDVLVSDGAGLLMRWEYTADCVSGVCHASAADQAGIALVSMTDGHTLWQKTIIPSYPAEVDYETRPQLLLEVATDRVALVSIGVGISSFHHDKPPTRTMAIDVPTGDTRWDRPNGVWPQEVVGNTVLGTVSTPEWTVIALDVDTGLPTWAKAKDLDRSEVEQVAGDAVLLRVATDGEPERYLVVDAATGRTITEFDRSEYITSCADDDHTVIACVSYDKTYDDKVTVFRVDKRTVTTATVDYGGDLRADDAWSGRVQISGTPRGETDRRTFTMDITGNVIDKNLRLPGTIEDLSADRATVITEDGIVEVYQVLR